MGLRCVIVDDNDHFLDAAREALEREGITVVAVASNREDALARVGELRPDVVLVDVSLGDECGFELIDEMAAAGSGDHTAMILISTYAESDFTELLEAGPARAFLPKTDLSGEAIREILAHG